MSGQRGLLTYRYGTLSCHPPGMLFIHLPVLLLLLMSCFGFENHRKRLVSISLTHFEDQMPSFNLIQVSTALTCAQWNVLSCHSWCPKAVCFMGLLIYTAWLTTFTIHSHINYQVTLMTLCDPEWSVISLCNVSIFHYVYSHNSPGIRKDLCVLMWSKVVCCVCLWDATGFHTVLTH